MWRHFPIFGSKAWTKCWRQQKWDDMGNLNISTRKERQQGFTARGQPLLYDQWLESCAWSNVGHWSENSIFPYTFYTEAEKNVNRNNFVKKHLIAFKFGQEKDIKERNISWEFGENRMKWRHVTSRDVIFWFFIQNVLKKCWRHQNCYHMGKRNTLFWKEPSYSNKMRG